jgi:hypothetical protein
VLRRAVHGKACNGQLANLVARARRTAQALSFLLVHAMASGQQLSGFAEDSEPRPIAARSAP